MTRSTPERGESTADKPYRRNPLWHLYDKLAEEVDHHLGWFKLPPTTVGAAPRARR